MARGMPSMTALLAVLAVAGYQNRDKLAAMLGGGERSDGIPGRVGGPGTMPAPGEVSSGGGLLGGIGSMLNGGLGELVDRFRNAGHGDTVDSWVRPGSNRAIAPTDLETALGADTLEDLTRQTGLSREEVIARLTRNLPDAVDRYTPDGRIPAAG